MLAIILNRRDYRENDQIVTAYTKDAGKVELLARGVKKSVSKNAAYLEPFFIVNLSFVPGKTFPILTTIIAETSFADIAGSIDAMRFLDYILTVADKQTNTNEKDERIFNLLVDWFLFLNTHHPTAEALLQFLLKFWSFLGYHPVLGQCVQCGEKEAYTFAPRAGGVLCATHAPSAQGTTVRLNVQEIQTFVSFLLETFDQVRTATPPLRQAIAGFLEEHAVVPLPRFPAPTM